MKLWTGRGPGKDFVPSIPKRYHPIKSPIDAGFFLAFPYGENMDPEKS
jgi:hypothetical protein